MPPVRHRPFWSTLALLFLVSVRVPGAESGPRFCAEAQILLSPLHAPRQGPPSLLHPALVEIVRPDYEKTAIDRDPRILRLSASGGRSMVLTDAAGLRRRWTNSVILVQVWGWGTNAPHAIRVANDVAADLCARYRKTNEITAEVLRPAITNARPVSARYDVLEPLLERESRR